MNAYDVMDRVQVVVRVRQQEDVLDMAREWETVVATAFPSTGETDRRAWVQDALIAAIEAL